MNFDRLEKKLHQQIEGQWYGTLLSFFHGTGVDITDFRTYQVGDSPRNINRKLSAKHDTLWINKRQEEKDIQVDILLDINANRSGGYHEKNRDIVQARLADYLVFAKKYDFQSTTVHVPMESGLQSYACTSIESWLMGWKERGHRVNICALQKVYRSCLSDFLDQEVQRKKQRVILLFSDFLSIDKEQKKQLTRLDTKHIVAQISIDVPEVVGKNFIRV